MHSLPPASTKRRLKAKIDPSAPTRVSTPSSNQKGSSAATIVAPTATLGKNVGYSEDSFSSPSGQYWLLKSEPEDNFTEVEGKQASQP